MIQATNDEDLDGQDDTDDDKVISEDGFTFMTPEFDENDMEQALENPAYTEPQAKLPPQEAYETMKFQSPLSEEEMDVLDSVPGLSPEGGLTWVDDTDHAEWLMQQTKNRNQAMDKILEDQMYGAGDDEFVQGMTEEERMDRAGTDSNSGWSIRKGLKRVGRGIKRTGRAAGRAAKASVLTPASIAKKAGKWTAAKASAMAKAVASKAAYPIKRAARPAILATARAVAKRKGHAKPDKSDIKEANQRVIAAYAANRNPMVKFAAKVMRYVGTGVSGLSGEEAVTIVGLTGLEIAAIAGASALAITVLNKMLIPMLVGKAAGGAPPSEVPSGPEMDPGAEMAPDGSLPMPDEGMPAEEAYAEPETEASTEDYTEGDVLGKYYRSIKDPMADMDGDEFVEGMTEEERMDRAGNESSYDFSLGEQFIEGDDEQYVQGDDEQCVQGDGDPELILGDDEQYVQGEQFIEGDSFIEGRGKGKRPMTPERKAKFTALLGALKENIKKQSKTGKVDAKIAHRFAKVMSKVSEPRQPSSYWMQKLKSDLSSRNVKISGDEFVEGSFIGGEFVEGAFVGNAHLHVIGEDSTLGEFATEILGLEPTADQKQANEAAFKAAGAAIKTQAASGKVDSRLVKQWAKLASRVSAPKKSRKAWASQLVAQLASKNVAVVRVSGNSDSGQWLYKLDPRYWVKSSREKSFVDAEKRKWKENANAREKLKDQKKVLASAEKAFQAAQAAKASAQEAEDVESQLKDIEQSVSGEFVGADNAAQAKNAAIKAAAAREGRKEAGRVKVTSEALAAKISSGQGLSQQELGYLRKCIKSCQNLKRLCKALGGKPNDVSGYHSPVKIKSDFLGKGSLDEMTEIVGKGELDEMTEIVGNAETTEILGDNPTEILGEGPSSKMTDAEKKQLATIVKLAKQGKPQARYALAQLRKKGLVAGDTESGMGSLLSKAFKVATAPIWVPAKYGYKGAKYLGKKVGLISSPKSAAQVRANRIKALRAKRIAALKRREASLATTEAARRKAAMEAAQANREAAIATSAADAEEAAAAAEAEAENAAAEAEEAQYTEDDTAENMEGEETFVLGGEFVGSFVGAIANPKHKKIVQEASKNTPMGKKIRAGAAVYKAAKAGNPKAKVAVTKVAAKAKAGDPQAKRDYNAIKAGKTAVHAKSKAQKIVAAKARSAARSKARVDFRNKIEQGAANKLIRVSRKKQLVKLAAVEKKAAAGDKKSRAIIAACVARASKGDKKAKTQVKALKLVKGVRVAGKTPAERKRLLAAQKTVRLARKGNKRAIQNIKVIQAASKKGQPNAKRAEARLKVAARVEKTISTGKISAAPTKKSPVAVKAAQKVELVQIQKKVAAGAATREEALAGAKVAQKLGLKDEAAALAMKARSLRSATETLKNSATVAAAAQGNNAEAKELVTKTLESAEAGNPAGLNSAGNLAAVQAIDAVNKGQPMPPQVAEATQLIERSKAGDPEAKRIIARVTSQAQEGPNFNPNAVAPAIALVAAGGALAAIAAKPTAQAEWKAAAAEARGQKIEPGDKGVAQAEFAELYAKTQRGDATRAEANRARELAMGLGKPKLAAQISAVMPPVDLENPLTSMPDGPLEPISNNKSLLKESLKALFLATRDPLQNWREGVQSRGATSMAMVAPSAGRKR